MPKNRRTITSIQNRADGKSGALPQVEIANILDFQFLKIVSLEHTLLDDLKTYIHWQTTSPPHHHKY